jgi:hypothetical protein
LEFERTFEVDDLKVTKKGKFLLSFTSDKGEKLTLQIDSMEEIAKWHLGHLLTVKAERKEQQNKLS